MKFEAVHRYTASRYNIFLSLSTGEVPEDFKDPHKDTLWNSTLKLMHLFLYFSFSKYILFSIYNAVICDNGVSTC